MTTKGAGTTLEAEKWTPYMWYMFIALIIFMMADTFVTSGGAGPGITGWSVEFKISTMELGYLMGLAGLGSMATLVIRMAADRWGRKPALLWGEMVMIAVGMSVSLAYNLNSLLIFLIAWQFFTWPDIHAIMLAEEMPARRRGFIIGIVGLIAFAYGFVYSQWMAWTAAQRLPTWLGMHPLGSPEYVINPAGEVVAGPWGAYNWRLFFIIPAIFFVILPLVSIRLKETRRFEYMKKAREAIPREKRLRTAFLPLKRPYRRNLILVSITMLLWWIGYSSTAQYWYIYSIRYWLYQGYSIGQYWTMAVALSLITLLGNYCGITYFIGNTIAGWVTDRIGRKSAIYILCGTSWVVRVFFGTFPTPPTMMFTLQIGAMGLFGVSFILGIMILELFPTEIRGTAGGWHLFISRVGNVIGPIMVAAIAVWVNSIFIPANPLQAVLLKDWIGYAFAFAAMTFVWPLICLIVYFAFPDTKGIPLEEIERKLYGGTFPELREKGIIK